MAAGALRMNKFSTLSLLIILYVSAILPEVTVKATEVKTPVRGDKAQGCAIHVQNDLNWNTPILLNKDMQILLPDVSSGYVTLPVKEEVTFVCPGDGNHFLKPFHPKNVTTVVGRCVNGKIFDIGVKMNIKEITCKMLPESILRNISSSCNRKNYTLAEIGFLVNKTTFINQIKVCFDEQHCKPVYTKHELHPTMKFHQTGKSFSFRKVETYLFGELGEGPGDLYPCTRQKEVLAELLGSKKQVHEYDRCPEDRSTQLVKGHLSPNADFTFSFQQNATYYHANAAPQWMFFNNRNWKSLEERIRSQAYIRNRSLVIYTGTSDEPTFLPDVNGNNVEIFLSQINNKLPSPLYYWKLVYDPKTEKGIGFIGYNVHFDQDPPFFTQPKYSSICEKSGWFRKSEITLDKGLIYCMSVKDLITLTKLEDFKDKISGDMEYELTSDKYTRKLQEELPKSSCGELWSIGFKIVFVTILAMY
ncbi:hypothetical protein C0J52_08349 [Blattella germanica]|nr:hypothetical protein C0J52_08349 [Blattella germanica]